MKNLVLIMFMVSMASCGLFERKKPVIIKKAGLISQAMAVKYLDCKTGDAVKSDVEREVAKLLGVQSSGSVQLAAISSEDSFGGRLCSSLVSAVLPKLVDLSDKLLPDKWKEDECSLKERVNDLGQLAKELCGEFP